MPGATMAASGLDLLYGSAIDTAMFGRDTLEYSPLKELQCGVSPVPSGKRRFHQCGLGDESLFAAVSVAFALITDLDNPRFVYDIADLRDALKKDPRPQTADTLADIMDVRFYIFTDDGFTCAQSSGPLTICLWLQDEHYSLMSFDNKALFGEPMAGTPFTPDFTNRISPACRTFTDVSGGWDASQWLTVLARKSRVIQQMAPDVLKAMENRPFPWMPACIEILRTLYASVQMPPAIDTLLAAPPPGDTRRRTLALRIVEMKQKVGVMLAAAVREVAPDRKAVLWAIKLASCFRGGVPPWPMCGTSDAVPASATHYDPCTSFRSWCARAPEFIASDRGITATGIPFLTPADTRVVCGFPHCTVHFSNADFATPAP